VCSIASRLPCEIICDGLDIFDVLREPLRVRRERQAGLNRHYLPEMVKHLEDTAPKGADRT
jgi:hypothetical protein